MATSLEELEQEDLAVARIARDDGSSSTNLSLAVTQLHGTHFSVTHFIPSLRTSVTQILLRVLYFGSIRICGAVFGRFSN